MSTGPTEDPKAVIFYLYKTMEDLNSSVEKIEESLNKIHVDLAVLQQSSPQSKIKTHAAGGSMGAVVAAILMGIWEYLKKN